MRTRNRAAAGCSSTIRTTSPPSQLPVWPRTVLVPPSCSRASKAKPVAVGPPAGEGAGGLADVLLGVVADAQAEQLHQLAGIVLVGLPLDVAVGVEPDEHGRVPADRLEQRAELAQGVRPQQHVLAEHQDRVLHLGEAGGEVVVPEQRHLLAQRVAALEHAVQPPAAELIAVVVALGGDPADVDQRLQRSRRPRAARGAGARASRRGRGARPRRRSSRLGPKPARR